MVEPELAEVSKPMSVGEELQPRPPRHSLIRRGELRWDSTSLPVRLRNISADGAMIESDRLMEAGSDVELDLADGLRLTGQVRWSKDGRIGVKFAEAFDLKRLGMAKRAVSAGMLMPDYLRSETEPDSPWAGRQDRLSIKDVKRSG